MDLSQLLTELQTANVVFQTSLAELAPVIKRTLEANQKSVDERHGLFKDIRREETLADVDADDLAAYLWRVKNALEKKDSAALLIAFAELNNKSEKRTSLADSLGDADKEILLCALSAYRRFADAKLVLHNHWAQTCKDRDPVKERAEYQKRLAAYEEAKKEAERRACLERYEEAKRIVENMSSNDDLDEIIKRNAERQRREEEAAKERMKRERIEAFLEAVGEGRIKA